MPCGHAEWLLRERARYVLFVNASDDPTPPNYEDVEWKEDELYRGQLTAYNTDRLDARWVAGCNPPLVLFRQYAVCT